MEYKLPKITISPLVNIDVPDDFTKVDIRYPLIHPYSYAHIYFDKSTFSLRYSVEEPNLNDAEKKLYNLILEVMKQILFVDFSKIKDINEAILILEKLYSYTIKELKLKLTENSYSKIFYYIFRDLYGYGKIEPLFRDLFIEDIGCSGVNSPVYVVHRYFGNLETNIIFNSEDEIRAIIEKFSLRSGRNISYAEPILDATLPDGSRVNATYSSDVTTRGPTFTIRKFRERPWSPAELIKLETASAEIMAYLWLATEYKRNIMIIGGTSTGKTTMLNAISMFIPPNDRIVSIEDTREIRLVHKNWIPAVVRYASSSITEVDMNALLKASFRQNPQYVIVGEVRGQEAYIMFQGMASGHAAISTMHASGVKQLISRLITPPISLPRTLIELLDIVIVMEHDLSMGKNIRRIKEVDEIIDYKRYNVAFYYDHNKRKYVSSNRFYLLYKISRDYGISYFDLLKEMNRRKMLLMELVRRNILDYSNFSRIISLYYLNKENVLKMFNL